MILWGLCFFALGIQDILEKLAQEYELKPDRAWVMVRTAQRTFAKIVREMVAADIDSTNPDDIDREIESL